MKRGLCWLFSFPRSFVNLSVSSGMPQGSEEEKGKGGGVRFSTFAVFVFDFTLREPTRLLK